MASSQAQVAGVAAAAAASSSVLRDRNCRDRCSPKAFQKNFRDSVHSCISPQQGNFDSGSDENRVGLLRVHKPQQYLDARSDQWSSDAAFSENWGLPAAEGKVRVCEISRPKSESSFRPSSGGVSSLVRKWSDFEAVSKTTNSSGASKAGTSAVFAEVPDRHQGSDACEESSSKIPANGDSSSLCGWESDRTLISGPQSLSGIDSDAPADETPGKERIKVADIVRKLSSSAPADETPGKETRDDPQSKIKSSESNRKARPSILHLRERFCAGIHHSITQSKAMNGKAFASNQSGEEDHHGSFVNNCSEVEGNNKTSRNGNISTLIGVEEEESNHHSQITDFAVTDPMGSQEEVQLDTQNLGGSFSSTQLKSYLNDDTQQQKLEHFHDETGMGRVSSDAGCNDQSIEAAIPFWDNEGGDDSSICWEQDDQESLESDSPEQPEVGQDWVTDVSRPRSEWQDLRQARYEEMLDPFSDNNDIRELLQRRSVSKFLSGSMRDKIEQMMISRLQRPPVPVKTNMQETTRDKMPVKDDGNEVEDPVQVDEIEYKGLYDDLSGDEYDGVGWTQEQPDDGTGEESYQSWGQNQDVYTSFDSDRVASIASPRSQCANFSSPRSYPPSSTCHPSNEIELIYELREHMVQLHQEMSELRSSIKSYTNMFAKLQGSLKHGDAAALNKLGQKRRSSSSKHPSNQKCCICFEMKIDSLLYRCGHMCTCFNCAHELVWSNGKCPVCHSPIVDVVRAVYAHS
ncbi:unnamed protein product [Cuscuta campestris]|uniref:RING-type domain-containing protein n=1 Tax=Cuscuta campestris TaxID=132261 RepID=A0A484KFW4_9ASTE|nr:unnamed protein product [Cuscuta campestris]